MKSKIYVLIAMIIICIVSFTGCGCKHEWAEASCDSPKTCILCGETEGAPIGHSWLAATCVTPKTCEVCAVTEGDLRAHTWEEATCAAPKACSVCDLTEGEPLAHEWREATTEAPQTCKLCAVTEGERIITDSRFTTAAAVPVFGTWKGEFIITGDTLAEEGLEGITGSFLFDVDLTMNNDGTWIFSMVPKDDSLKNAVIEYTENALYAAMEEENYSREETDKNIQEIYGVTVREWVTSSLEDVEELAVLYGGSNGTGVYYIEGNTLYYADTWNSEMSTDRYYLTDDTLTFDNFVLVPLTRVTE